MAESSFLNPSLVIRTAGIHEGMKIADFGSGAGFFARAAAREVGVQGAVWAVELQHELLPRLKNLALAEGLTNLEVIRGDVEHIGGTHLPDGTFDVVLLTNMLFVLECKSCLAQEVARVLKPHGRVVVVDWASSFGGLGPHESHVVTEAAARSLFETHGFVYAGDIPAGEYHWGMMLKKQVQ